MKDKKPATRVVKPDAGRRRVVRSTAAVALATGAGTLLGFNPLVFAQSARKIKIGYVSPQTGPLAPFGEADKFVIEGVRQALKNGIAIGGKSHPVEIIVKDSQSNPNRAGEVAADLILKDKIDLMLVASTPETTNPVSDQCELNEIPCISTVAPWQPWYFTRGGTPDKGFNWTYHFFWGLEDVIAVFTNLWSSVQTNKMVGGLFPNDGDGNAWGDTKLGFPPVLSKMGYKLTDPGRFQTLTDRLQRADRRVQGCQRGSGDRCRDPTRLQNILDASQAARLQAESRIGRQSTAVPAGDRSAGRSRRRLVHRGVVVAIASVQVVVDRRFRCRSGRCVRKRHR